jgi:hypothetical protein
MFDPIRRLFNAIKKREVHCPYCQRQIHGSVVFGLNDEANAKLFIHEILKAMDEHVQIVFGEPKK